MIKHYLGWARKKSEIQLALWDRFILGDPGTVSVDVIKIFYVYKEMQPFVVPFFSHILTNCSWVCEDGIILKCGLSGEFSCPG